MKNMIFLTVLMAIVSGIVAGVTSAQSHDHTIHKSDEGTNGSKSPESTTKKVSGQITAQMKDFPANTPKNRLSNLVAFAETQLIQSGSIKASIALANQGDREIKFLNPLDFIHITILNDQGQLVELPVVAPRFLINTKGPNRNKVRLPFAFSVSLNGHILTGEKVNQAVFSLLPNEHLQIAIEVTQIQEKQQATRGADQPISPRKLIRIPPGDYMLKMTLRIGDPVNVKIRRQLESDFFKVNLSNKPPLPSPPSSSTKVEKK